MTTDQKRQNNIYLYFKVRTEVYFCSPVAVQYYEARLLACRILPRECGRTFLIHPKWKLSFKKYHLLHNTDWFQNRWIPRRMLLVELLICISMYVEMGLAYNFIRSFFFLSVTTFFCLSYPFSTLFLVCFFLSVFPYFFLLSSFHAAIILCVVFSTFLSLFFVVCCLLLIFFYQSLFSSYFLPFICLYLSIIFFFLSSDITFLPSFINL